MVFRCFIFAMNWLSQFFTHKSFQRFRATEECNADFCSFAGQRTTHFHCIRDSCNYTFKNKAEMGMNTMQNMHFQSNPFQYFVQINKNAKCLFKFQKSIKLITSKTNCWHVMASKNL